MGASLRDLGLTPRATLLSTCLFSQGPPKLRVSRLCQDFLAKMLICLPSRLQQASLLFGLHCMCAGERRPGNYLQSRIYPSLPCDTVSKQHIIQAYPTLFLKPALLMRLFCALTSLFSLAVNTPACAVFHSCVFFLNPSPVQPVCEEGLKAPIHKHADETGVGETSDC